MHKPPQSSCIVLDTGKAAPQENMDSDARLLEQLATHPSETPILHFYDWNGPAATYGYFIDPATLICCQSAQKCGLQLARRPTGGGLILHVADFAFSLLVPAAHAGYSVNTLENYAFVNNAIIKVLNSFGYTQAMPTLLKDESMPLDKPSKNFCMAKPTKYDVVIAGKKVGGGAQRRTKHGFLHQGTISLTLPDEALLKQILLPDTRVLEAMHQNTYALLNKPSARDLAEARHLLKSLLIATMTETEGN